MSTDRVAWVFPGQGAPAQSLLQYLSVARGLGEVENLHARLCAALGDDPADIGRRDPDLLSANRTSSLIMTFISLALMRHAAAAGLAPDPQWVAGYSVGQWAALHAAGIVDADMLFSVLATRAERMDEAIEGHGTGMLGIVGVAEAEVERICSANRQGGGRAIVANYNSIANLTVSGSLDDVEQVRAGVAGLNPKVLERLPVAGAWHSPFLDQAASAFRQDLSSFELDPARLPVIDNTTGEWLPLEGDNLRERLARQICEPVRWYQGLRTMIDAGANLIVEIGAGNMLSTFGMFYDRTVRHVPLSRLSRPLAEALRGA